MEFKAVIAELNSVKVESRTVTTSSSSSNNNNNNNDNNNGKCGTDNCPVHFDCDDDQLFHTNPRMKTEHAADFPTVRVKTELTCDSSFFTDDGGNVNDCDTCVERFVHNRSRDPSEVSMQLEQTSTVTSESISSSDQARLHAAETSREEPKYTKIPEESGSVAVDNGNEMTSIHNTPIGVSLQETTNIEQGIDTDGAPEDRNKTPPISANRHECLDCLKRFSSKANMTRHIKRMHGGGEKLNKCRINFECPRKETEEAINPTDQEQSGRQRCRRKIGTSRNSKSQTFQHSKRTPHNYNVANGQKVFEQAANVHNGIPLNSFQNTYGCPHCTKKFTSSRNAKRHLMLHTREKPNICRMCEKTFRRYTHLKVHMLSHTAIRPYKCPHCGQLFRRSQHLKSHLHWRSGEKPHTCPHCEKQFSTLNESRNHVVTVHPFDGPNSPCSYCKRTFVKDRSMTMKQESHKSPQFEKTFASPRNAERRIVVHTRENPLPCPCSKVQKQKANLQNSHGCLHCTKKFASSSNAKRRLMLPTGEKPYLCRMCEKKFRSYSGLKVHMLSHTGKMPYKCPHCEKLFRQSQHLKSHLHWRSGEKPHTCPHCEKEFATFSDSMNHVFTVHPIDGLKSSPCPYCKQIFAKVRSLKTNIQLHKCPQCEKSFASPRNVKRHIMMHNGEKPSPPNDEKPYPCPQCGKKFRLSRSVRRHLTTCMHSGVKPHDMILHSVEKPYKCPKCDHSFRQRKHLKSHLLHLHSDERLHGCPHCEKKFKTPSDVKRHVMIHSRENHFA